MKHIVEGGIRNDGRGAPASKGYTLVEVMISLVILVVAVTGYSGAIISTSLSADTTREVRAATEAARNVVERLHSVPLAEAFVRFNADPDDDPGGSGSAQGAGFPAFGLQAVDGDDDGAVGEILLPAVWVDGVLQLREDLEWPALGMPRDLNGDGLIDELDHSLDYLILPVLVRVRWQGASGETQIEFRTTLSEP